jgi:hypothetical protein
MVSFAKWLTDQKDREDATGTVARMWAEDPTRGNISSIKGYLAHVESWDTYRDVLPAFGLTVQQAADQAVGEWRRQRTEAQVSTSVETSEQPELPGVTDQGNLPESPISPGRAALGMAADLADGSRGAVLVEQAAWMGIEQAMNIQGARDRGIPVRVSVGVLNDIEAELRARLNVNPDATLEQALEVSAALAAAGRDLDEQTGREPPAIATAMAVPPPVAPFEAGSWAVVHWITPAGASHADAGQLLEITDRYVRLEGDAGTWAVVPWHKIELIEPWTQSAAYGGPERAQEAVMAAGPPGAPPGALWTDQAAAGDRLAPVVPIAQAAGHVSAEVAATMRHAVEAYGDADARAAMRTAGVEAHHRSGQYLPGSYVADGPPPSERGPGPFYHWPSLYAAADHDAAAREDQA